jgi:hypothetical protein
MERPASLKVIAALFFLLAAYLVVIGVGELVSPGTLAITRATGITYGRELDGPQTAILVGAGWALVAWGLYRLHNWARWCAVVLLVVGVAGSVPAVSAAARDLGSRFFFYGAQVIVRVVVIWYLIFSGDADEAFAQK